MTHNYFLKQIRLIFFFGLLLLAGCAEDDSNNTAVTKEMMKPAEIDNSRPLVSYI